MVLQEHHTAEVGEEAKMRQTDKEKMFEILSTAIILISAAIPTLNPLIIPATALLVVIGKYVYPSTPAVEIDNKLKYYTDKFLSLMSQVTSIMFIYIFCLAYLSGLNNGVFVSYLSINRFGEAHVEAIIMVCFMGLSFLRYLKGDEKGE